MFRVEFAPVFGMAPLLVLELVELLLLELEELEELPVLGVAVGVAALELPVPELEELPVLGVAVGVAALLLEVPLLEVPLLDVPLLDVVPPVTGTPAPATLLLPILALKPILVSLSRKPRIICSQLARFAWGDPKFELLFVDELLPLLLLVVFVPRPATVASACCKANAY